MKNLKHLAKYNKQTNKQKNPVRKAEGALTNTTVTIWFGCVCV